MAALTACGETSGPSAPTFNCPHSVAAGDFNGDRVPNLAVANFNFRNVSVLLGNGDSIFRALKDRLLYARVKELGLSESADLLLKGEELVIPITRHSWPLP